MENIKINNSTIDLKVFLELDEVNHQKFLEDCTDSCFNAGCCYETRGALTKQEVKPQHDFTAVEDCQDSCFTVACCYETQGALTKPKVQLQHDFTAVEDCTDSCFNAGCCYETRGALTKQEVKPQHDFTAVEDCTDSCFNAGCCYETRGAVRKKEIFNFTHRKKLSSVHLEITHSCNHKCFYCFNTLSNQKAIDKSTIDEVSNIADNLVITGGEPFVNPKQVVDIVRYATSLNFKHISINTNASLIEEEVLLELAQINPNISFLVSIPTVNSIHYEQITGVNDLDTVLNNIKLLIKIFGEQNIVGNMVIHKLNMYDISETAETLYKLGLRLLKHSFMAPYKESKKYVIEDNDIDYIFKSLAENKNKYDWFMFGSTHAFPLCRIPNSMLNNKYPFVKCGAGNTIASISTDGLMYSCPSMNSNAIQLSDFTENRAKLLSHKQTLQNIQQPCKDCGLLAYCGAGCMCENQLMGGSLYSAPLYAKQLTDEEVLLRKVSLGIPCNINDVLDFEKVNELYSRIRFCNTWLNKDLILFSNDLVERIVNNEFSIADNRKFMQLLLKIHQTIRVA